MKPLSGLVIFLVLWIACEKEHDPEPRVTCSFLSPSSNELVQNGDEINFRVSTSAPVEQVEFLLDGSPLGVDTTEPFSLIWTPTDITGGNHRLACVALIGNGDEARTEISLFFPLNLGDLYQGGRVFYIDESGRHGLIVATDGISANGRRQYLWGAVAFLGATEMNDGLNNTQIMAVSSAAPQYAGFAFRGGFSQNGYGDWYIPAIEELIKLAENRVYLEGTPAAGSDSLYWSSTEVCRIKALAVHIVKGSGLEATKNDHEYRIIPIRKF